MQYSEDQLLPLSALQHLHYCERQCALIHLEQLWVENFFTAAGRVMHDRVDRPEHEVRDGIRVEFAVPLKSMELGLIGKADVVEYHSTNSDSEADVPQLIPYPVEHKRGKPKPTRCDEVQLCAQALCLEEMMNLNVGSGAIFYGKPRRRVVVEFSESLRDETKAVAERLHALISCGETPAADYDKKKCSACSLLELCMPKKSGTSVEHYIQEALK